MSEDLDQTPQEPSRSQGTNKRAVNRPPKSIESKLWDLLQPVARLWGLLTAIMLSGAGAELTVLRYEVAPAVIVGAVLVFILETMWVVALFVDLLCRRGEYSLKIRCWDFTRWSCARIRPPFYACAATAILFANLTILATASGGLLLVLGGLRAAVPFSPYARRARAGSALLPLREPPPQPRRRSEEMKVLDSKTQERPSVTPVTKLLEL